MTKINFEKSFYTTSLPTTIAKELNREFRRFSFKEVIECASPFPEFRLVTVTVMCYSRDLNPLNKFLSRFDADLAI